MYRCRLTEKPIELDSADAEDHFQKMFLFRLGDQTGVDYAQELRDNREKYPFCRDSATNATLVADDPSWNQRTSPWRTPRHCVWPPVEHDEDYCGGPRSLGSSRSCLSIDTCGADYDRVGNRRFVE